MNKKPKKTDNDFSRVILEVLTRREGPTVWLERNGISQETMQNIVQTLDLSLLDLTKKDKMEPVTAHTAMLVTAFMFGWECGIELGR